MKSISEQLKTVWPKLQHDRFIHHLTTLPTARLREMLQSDNDDRKHVYAELQSRKSACASNSKRRSSRPA